MNTIAKLPRSVKSPNRQPALHRSWQQRKLSAELDSSTEISHAVNCLRHVLRTFCIDEATGPQSRFLRDCGFPLLAALERSLRRCRILSEIRDEAEVQR
jgi:hypothetical protein